MNEEKYFKPKEILLSIFRSMFSQWKSYEFDERKCDHIIWFGGRNKQKLKYILENVPNSNIIAVQRDPWGIVATRGKVGKYDIDEWLSNGRIFDYIEYDNFLEDMKAKHEDKIHIINFRDLILNAYEEMKDVVEFLNILEEEVLKYPIFAGERLEEEYLGRVNDDWRDILSEYERNVAELQMGEKEKSDASIKELTMYPRWIHITSVYDMIFSHRNESEGEPPTTVNARRLSWVS